MEAFSWIMLALFAIIVIAGFIIKFIVPFKKLTKEERKQKLLDLLYSLVVIAEHDIKGSGMGAAKLGYVEDLFYKNAPFIYKLFLKFSDAKDLKELVEEALTTVKDNFKKAE